MKFDIPIVLFFFKRKDTIIKIIDVLREVKPRKIYLIADGYRNDDEKKFVYESRLAVETAIDWECEIVKNYVEQNQGVYNRIGMGAKWVFTFEEQAIFLEDDNLPDLTFFSYCSELLEKYSEDNRILWICGTNYLGKYKTKNENSYYFTQNLLPCGWASWKNKFNKYYIDDLSYLDNNACVKNIKANYKNKALFRQQLFSIESEYDLIKKGLKPRSWDYQMAFSIRINNLVGIAPKYNLIKNIGIDSFSIHGGTSNKNIMTKRFCEIETFALEMPLIHPQKVEINRNFEKKIENIILYPLSMRMKIYISNTLKFIFKIDKFSTFKRGFIKKYIKKGKL